MVKASIFEVIFIVLTKIKKKGGIYTIPPFYQKSKKISSFC